MQRGSWAAPSDPLDLSRRSEVQIQDLDGWPGAASTRPIKRWFGQVSTRDRGACPTNIAGLRKGLTERLRSAEGPRVFAAEAGSSRSLMPMSKPQMEERVVVFADALGTKKQLFDATTASDFVEKILLSSEAATDRLRVAQKRFGGLIHRWFSDCLCLSVPFVDHGGLA